MTTPVEVDVPLYRLPHIQECGDGLLDKYSRCVVCLHNHGRWRDDEWRPGDFLSYVPSNFHTRLLADRIRGEGLEL